MSSAPLKPRRLTGDRIMDALVKASGLVVVVIVAAIFYYLCAESRYAFKRTWDYGYRFAFQPVSGEFEKNVDLDPNASLLTANREGADGLDEKEETIPAPSIEMLAGTAMGATATTLVSEAAKVDPASLWKDDWRARKPAEQGDQMVFYVFATPEYRESTMTLAWVPDASFVPTSSPYGLKLRLIRGPEGVPIGPIEIDLKSRPSGTVKLPTFVAKTDADRTRGYAFALVSEPAPSNVLATLGGLTRSAWDPTLSYAVFGVLPLFWGTLLITGLAILIAAPISLACAVIIGTTANRRVREWLKNGFELLASVPTVVLGYFGLMILAPKFQSMLGQAIGMESGRSLFTTSVVLAILLVPTITSLAEDAITRLPGSLKEGAEALGLTLQEQLSKVILPAAKPGLIGAVLLGFARAIGETMIVWILSGGTARIPGFGSVKEALGNLGASVRGVPDTVAIEMGNVEFEGVHYGHLFLLGLMLFAATLVLNIVGYRIARRATWRS